MSNVGIALLIALSGGVWIYAKTMRRTGSNTAAAVTIGAIVAVLVFVVVVTGLSFINKH